MVLEVVDRDILARVGTWKGQDRPEVRVPLLLETRPTILGMPDDAAEAVLLFHDQQAPAGPLAIRDMGSAIRPPATDGSPGDAHLVIPPEHPLPPALAGALADIPVTIAGERGLVEVVHGSYPSLGSLAPPSDGTELVVLASAAHLVRKPDRFVDTVVATRRRAGPGRLLYIPGVATPRNLALLAYMGADVVDDVQCHLEAARGRLTRPELGHVHHGGDATPHALSMENLDLLRREVALVRDTIVHGALRELVEVRVRSEPWQVAALRRLDGHHKDLLVGSCPVHRDKPLLALSRESLQRVEVTAWTDRFLERYSPPPSARVLVLLPCSARKPYSLSRTHRRIHEAMAHMPNWPTVHEVILTSPLGAVPRELERSYPAAQYDIPVSGNWFPDEVERMRLLTAHIRAEGGYDAVISHMGVGLPFVDEDDTILRTRREEDGPLDGAALQRLAGSVAEAASTAPRVSPRVRATEELASLVRFQFGPMIAQALMEGARADGRGPGWKLKDANGLQRGAVVPSRGLLSLTLAGAELVAKAGHHRVWMDDFDLRGDLFAVGVVGADPDLRPGEEVVVLKGDDVVAVGVARMGAAEMLASSRGVAVAMRHKRGGGGER